MTISLTSTLSLGPRRHTLLTHAAPHAREHGVAKLAVAVDVNTLTIALAAPLDGFLDSPISIVPCQTPGMPGHGSAVEHAGRDARSG